MEKEKLSYEELESRFSALVTTNVQLRIKNESLLNEAQRWQKNAAEEHRSWVRVHDAMNLLREDAQRVLDEHGATPVHRELQETREKLDKLAEKWSRVRQFARQTVETKARIAQANRDLDEALQGMKERCIELEKQRDELAAQAEKVVAERDRQIATIKEWCERYSKGEFSPMEILAAIHHVADADVMIAPTVLERRRAAEHMHVLMLMNEATDQLTLIEIMLHDEGIPNTESQLQQVRDLLARRKAAEADYYRLWELIEGLAKKLDADPELLKIAERYDAAGLEDYVGEAGV